MDFSNAERLLMQYLKNKSSWSGTMTSVVWNQNKQPDVASLHSLDTVNIICIQAQGRGVKEVTELSQKHPILQRKICLL